MEARHSFPLQGLRAPWSHSTRQLRSPKQNKQKTPRLRQLQGRSLTSIWVLVANSIRWASMKFVHVLRDTRTSICKKTSDFLTCIAPALCRLNSQCSFLKEWSALCPGISPWHTCPVQFYYSCVVWWLKTESLWTDSRTLHGEDSPVGFDRLHPGNSTCSHCIGLQWLQM